MPDIDWTAVGAALLEHRLAWETFGLVVVSALVGFLIARALYRGQVSKRAEVLRLASATWRRRIAQEQRASDEIGRERDRANRQRRQLKRKLPPQA
jgi:HAMP domain-containing protein